MFEDLKLAFFLTGKYIRRGNLGTLFMTVLIMALCFLNLTLIPSLFTGLVAISNQQFVDYQYANVVIEPEEGKNYLENVRNIESLISGVSGVQAYSPHYICGSVLEYDEDRDGKDTVTGAWVVKSVDVAKEKATTKLYQTMIDGEYLEKGDRNKIIIGKEIAGGYGGPLENMSLKGVRPGDKINVHYNNGVKREYEVKGIFDTSSVLINQIAFVTEDELESVLGYSNMASEIIVKIEKTGEEAKYIKTFQEIGVKGDIKPWEEYTGIMESMNESFDMVQIILGSVGIVVAAITIFIVIYVSVISKKRQIGILKAIGMKEGVIIMSFVFHALFFGICGVVIGMLSTYFILEPYFVNNPIDFPLGQVSLVIESEVIISKVVWLIIASFFGGLIPAMKGARESILEAMWGSN